MDHMQPGSGVKATNVTLDKTKVFRQLKKKVFVEFLTYSMQGSRS